MVGIINEDLQKSFINLFLSNAGVPSTLDINVELHNVLQGLKSRKSSSIETEKNLLLNDLCEFSHQMLVMNDYFEAVSVIGYRSMIYAEDPVYVKEENIALSFVSRLILGLQTNHDKSTTEMFITHFKELATHIIMFNGVSKTRVNYVMKVFQAIFEYACTQPICRQTEFNTRKCHCWTFEAAGDCSCPIRDMESDFSASHSPRRDMFY